MAFKKNIFHLSAPSSSSSERFICFSDFPMLKIYPPFTITSRKENFKILRSLSETRTQIRWRCSIKTVQQFETLLPSETISVSIILAKEENYSAPFIFWKTYPNYYRWPKVQWTLIFYNLCHFILFKFWRIQSEML